jgi:hypothetical protein
MLPDGRALIGLDKTAFQARVRGHSAEIESLDENLTPKRVLLVLDASKNLSTDAWKIETSLTLLLLEGSPQTSFALVVLNADNPILDFTASRDTLRSKIAELAVSRPPSAKATEDLYASLVGAVTTFGPPQFGDSTFAFIGGSDDSGRVDVGALQRSLLERNVRLFGLILGQKARSGFYMAKQGGDVPFDPDTDEIGQLAAETGGALAVENTRMEWTTYHLTDDRLKLLEVTAHHLYSQMVTPYQIQIVTEPSTRPEDLSIVLSDAIKQKVPTARVLYPHQLVLCSPQVTH